MVAMYMATGSSESASKPADTHRGERVQLELVGDRRVAIQAAEEVLDLSVAIRVGHWEVLGADVHGQGALAMTTASLGSFQRTWFGRTARRFPAKRLVADPIQAPVRTLGPTTTLGQC